ncbi:MAG: hydantoinase B/oxoprolinase family protein [Micromonosporaceae bacterium]
MSEMNRGSEANRETARAIDPLALGALWRGLAAAANDGGLILQRTAYSEAVREGRDFSVAVFDARGRMIAQGDFSPGHLGSMPGMIDRILECYPREDIRPGDVYAFNDPWMGSGHLPDWMVAAPFFHDGELAGYAVTCVHMIDVGGASPGSQQVVGISENYQEGVRLTPTRLWREGEPNAEVVRLLEANVRVPDKLLGDLRANRNAGRVVGQRVTELVARFGRKAYDEGCDALLDLSEQALRDAIRDMPDGVYRAFDHLDDCGPDTDPIRIEAAITIDGGDLTLDFTGSDPQTRSGMNAVENYTRAYCYFTIKAITHGYRIPQNVGALRPIHWIAPEGTIVNLKRPGGNGGRAIMQQRIVDVLMQAFAQAVPDRVVAPSSHWANPIISGTDQATGRRFVFYDVIVGGFGGRADSDGPEAMSASFNIDTIPTEVNEHSYPVVVERYELIPDSAGAGRFRGGHGVRKEVRVLGEDLQLSNLAERQRIAPPGVRGGEAGSVGKTVIVSTSGERRQVHSKGTYPLQTGDLVCHTVSGGAGYGDPRERDPEAIERDLRLGLLTPEKAARVYGHPQR